MSRITRCAAEPTRLAAEPSRLPLVGGLLLVAANGFTDSYTFLAQGRVFAEAMTGNLVLIGVGVFDPSVTAFWRPLSAYGSFLGGVACVWVLARGAPGVTRLAQHAALAVEVVVLAIVGFLPGGFPQIVVVVAIAFAAGLQIAAFNRIGVAKLTTIVMTSNSLHAVEASLKATTTHERSDRLAAALLLSVLGSFVLGVFAGGLLTHGIGTRAAWGAAALFLGAAAIYAARPQERNTPKRE